MPFILSSCVCLFKVTAYELYSNFGQVLHAVVLQGGLHHQINLVGPKWPLLAILLKFMDTVGTSSLDFPEN